MPDQPDLKTRIARALKARMLLLTTEDATGLAEVLVRELGLSREWALSRGNGCQTVMTEDAVRAAAARRPEASTVVARWVTEWRDQ